MTRIKFLGLALVAVFATVGVLAASASATGPAWFECAKLTKNGENKYTGKYTDKLCTEEASPTEVTEGKHNKYELKEGLGSKGKSYKTKSGSFEFIVKTPLGSPFHIKCNKGSKGTAKPELPNKVTDINLVFKGCEFLEESCHSPSAKKGELVANGLVGELGYVKPKVGSPPQVGLEIKNPLGEAEPLTSFICGTENPETHKQFVTGKIVGAVIGVEEKVVNTVSKETVLNFTAEEQYGEHEFETKKYFPSVNIVGFEAEEEAIQECVPNECEEEHPAHVLRGEFCGAFVEQNLAAECSPLTYTGLNQTSTNKGEALEIKA